MAFRRQLGTELAYNPVSAEVQLSQKRSNNAIQTLQTIFQYFLGQLIEREVTVLDEREEQEQEQAFGSTASVLFGLTRPAPKPKKRARRSLQEEFAPSVSDFMDEQEDELEQVLGLKPQFQPRKKRKPVAESVFDPLMDFVAPPLAPQDDFSPSLFVGISQAAFLVLNEEMQEASLFLVTAIVIGLAVNHMAYQHCQQPEFQDAFEFPASASTLHSRDFGNPLPLFMPRFVLPNAQSMFAPNYYQHPAAPSRPAMPEPRNEQRLEALGFPMDLIPEKYRCEMMSTVMDNPVKLPVTGQVCDGRAVLESLSRKPENPYNRQPMRMEEAKPDLALRSEISRYVDTAATGVQNRRQALGSNSLSQADYQAIHERALQAAQQPTSRAALAAPQEEPSAPENSPASPRMRR